MSNAFYPRFERHSHGEGLKAFSTHYCPGCGHGLVHKYLAEAIDDLGIQNRTVAVSPVGCAVFLYYYLDAGNTQAAHGRAPAVALGHKLANPNAMVVAYQGDGDLASIGIAEIIQVCQMGLPMSFIFVNNAVYAMTGGQMAPTTLMRQVTTTTPYGRKRLPGEPLKIAELIAQLDGPVYVERVALFDNKQRVRAKKAIQKALQVQLQNRGLGFVEVLAECPTHLHLTPTESETWVKERMVPIFPLGVMKDVEQEPWFELQSRRFGADDIGRVTSASTSPVERFATAFPTHLSPRDISLKYAGAGGDGAQTIAAITSQVAVYEGFDSTYIPSYGPESRGGTSYADVHIATEEVFSPACPRPHLLVALNAPSLLRFGPLVEPGGSVVFDASVVENPPDLDPTIRLVGVPCSEIALGLGNTKVKNQVALGALQAISHIFPVESFLATMREKFGDRESLVTLNERAFEAGCEAVQT